MDVAAVVGVGSLMTARVTGHGLPLAMSIALVLSTMRVALRPSILPERTSRRVPCCTLAAFAARSRVQVFDVHGELPTRWQVTMTYMPFRSAALGWTCVRTPA